MLNEKQMAAITILSQPRRANKTYQEVADDVGVSLRTLMRWKNSPEFNDELKKVVVAKTLDRLPEVLESLPEIAMKDRSAAMMKLYLQMHGLLSDKLELNHKATQQDAGVDIEAIRARLQQRNEA